MSINKSLGYYIIYVLTRPLALLPLAAHRVLGCGIGKFLGKCIKYRRDVVMINLSRAYPEKNYKELSKICDRFYEHFAKVICETIWYGRSNINKVLAKSNFITIQNPELLGNYYDKAKTFFVLTSHAGNWETYGGLRSYCDPEILKFTEKEVCAVYKKLSSPAWDAFMYKNRISTVSDKKNYDGLQESRNVLRYAAKHRHEFKLYFCNMDQYPYADAAKIPVKFMGQDTHSMIAFPTLASKLGAAVMYLSYKEKEDGNYTMHFSLICEDASQTSVDEIINEYYRRLEEDLRDQPWNYLWTHKRWK